MSKMKKIIVVDNYDTRNNGVMAMGMSFVQEISNCFDKPEFSFFSSFEEVDKKRYGEQGIIVNPMFWKAKLWPGKVFDILYFVGLVLFAVIIKLFSCPKLNKNIERFRNADAIVSLCGEDLYSDHCSWQLILYELFPFVLAKVFNKPYVIFAQTLGPFNKKRSRFLLRYVIGMSSLVTIRESVSFDMVKNILKEEKSQFVFTGDSAFFLRPIEMKIAKQLVAVDLKRNIYDKKVVGISISHLFTQSIFPTVSHLEDKYKYFVEAIVSISDFLSKEYKVNIVFVPHVTVSHNDDRRIALDVLEKIKSKDSVFALESEYQANQIKGIIHSCDFFIGCRMHSLVAAVSGNIPTLALAYSYKTIGVIGPIVKDNLIVDVREISPEKLKENVLNQFNYLWTHESEVSDHINKNMKKQYQQSLKNFELLKNVMNK